MDLFRVRLNCIDHYQSSPTQFDPQLRSHVTQSQKQKEPEVPVIRVFGATETGQKVCAHIHGAFPYMYIEYTGSLAPDDVGGYIHRLHLSIDHALAVSYRRNVYEGRSNFVARVTLVKGIPFYGYHIGYRYFLKIYMLNPMNMTRLSDLLCQGAVMRQVFQPFEAHLQYLLQWMTDYNLYGCGYIDCKNVSFRGPVPRYDELDNLTHLWHDRSIPAANLGDGDVLPRVSHCSLEVDICVQDIMNRMDIKPRPLHHDFIERLNPMDPGEKFVHSMAGLWKDEHRRRTLRMGLSDPGSSPFPADMIMSMSAGTRNSQSGGWIHEEEYMEQVRSLISDERQKSDGVKLSFETFVKRPPYDSSVKTVLESVEDLYPENLAPILGFKLGGRDTKAEARPKDDKVDVDENRIFNLSNDDEDEFPYDSDEDVMRELELSQRKKGDHLEAVPFDSSATDDPEHAIDDELRPNGKIHTGQRIDPEPFARNTSLMRSNVYPLLDTTFVGEQATDTDPSSRSAILKPLLPLSRSSGTGIKRSRSIIPGEVAYIKRQRLEFPAPNIDNSPSQVLQESHSVGDREPMWGSKDDPVQIKHGDGTRRQRTTASVSTIINKTPRIGALLKPPSQESKESRLSRPRVLGFPVVKDPNESSTILRLSQGSSSQKSLDASLKKHVSFNHLPAQTSQNFPRPSPISSSSTSSRPHEDSRVIQTVLSALIDEAGGGDLRLLGFGELPPTSYAVEVSMEEFGLPSAIYQDAYYSNELDVPDRVREWAGREFKLESLTVSYLPDFDATGCSSASFGEKVSVVPDKLKEEYVFKQRRRACGLLSWQIAQPPPDLIEVTQWLRAEEAEGDASDAGDSAKPKSVPSPKGTRTKLSQIDGPTQKNRFGFKYTQKQKTSDIVPETQYMSLMSLEVHINTRGKLVPNPEEDEVQCVFWCLKSDDDETESNGIVEGTHVGIVVLSEDGEIAKKVASQAPYEVQEESSELDLLVRMVEIVRNHDPDILTGYEVHGGSWGYLIERARLKYDYNLCDEFSRMKSQSHGRFGKDNDKWGFNNTSTIRVTGRHMINIWRAMRSELNLLQYTMENVSFHLLHRRIPHYSWQDLTSWYSNGKLKNLAKVLEYYICRVQLDLEILDQNELIARTSEQARLLGVDFFSVFSRGSQFKVESLMFRIAKPENFILISPSRKQVGGQNALECLPLVMEPQSAFYNSPLLVLDFQSLYPSVMIAYNYCYSTFLGRIVNFRGADKMGFTEFKRQERLLELLKDHINISPNGMMYTKPEIRKSLLAKMLGEILETRVMVKSGMKVDKDDRSLQRLLNNRQLALKLIANVTYGYTSASFSGRMPCSEIADSIVQTGRETLEKAIALIHSVKRWGAEVVYGDTDSVFVYLKGRTKDQAFDIGQEIAKAVTDINPRPVKLKFEKVYFPCVLLAKKRYVGFKYEFKDQKEPEFDAKGIETVRRDGTPAEQKIEEKALKILFRTADLSQVKSYFQKECEKIMKGSVSIQDFCFAKEVRLGTYSEKGPPPPGALISTRRMLEDHRAEPQYGERVPYVVITGAPGARLIDRCVAPETLLHSDHIELDAEYYISKNLIPPLERIFNLVGANVRGWYDEMPKVQRIRRVDANLQLLGRSKDLPINKKTLESYMKSSSCLVCRDKLESEGSICATCLTNRPSSLLSLRTKLSVEERKTQALEKVCRSCSGFAWNDEVACDSKDCPVFYTRTRQKAKLALEKGILEPVMRVIEREDADFRDLEW